MKRNILTMRRSLLLLLFLLYVKSSFSQITSNHRSLSPDGIFDTVYDGMGNKIPITDLLVNDTLRAYYKGSSVPLTTTVPGDCGSGYFQPYFETGSGFEGSSPDAVARRAVLCQVLNDLSNLINSPLSSSADKVRIWVRSISSFGSGGLAGVATSYYMFPTGYSSSGIVDNLIWNRINNEYDLYLATVSPISIVGSMPYSDASIFFHGVLAINFSSGMSWNTNLSSAPTAGQTDLYSVIMHEMLHSMGFQSLINYDGNSKYSAYYQYYNRYDRYLKKGGTNLLVNGTTSCDMYNWSFNSSLSPSATLSPGSTSTSCPGGYTSSFSDFTNCADAVKYNDGIYDIPIYTPSCFEPPSSLSHFEDQCYLPPGFPLAMGTASNNQYFAMSNTAVAGPYSATTNPGALKRYPTPEERQVLCDIGYSVNSSYGSAANLNYKEYSGGACGESVGGINDGITMLGGYVYIASGTTPITINGTGATLGLLQNDHNAVSFKCLEVAPGYSGTVSTSFGTSSTTVTYTAGATTTGVQLLRYIPVSASGKEGNITYVLIYIDGAGCSNDYCDLINNGGFESYISGGIPWVNGVVSCWSILAGDPDLYYSGSSYTSWPTPVCTPETGVHEFSTSSNTAFLALNANRYEIYSNMEAMRTALNAPIHSGDHLRIGFWAKVADNIYGTPPGPMKIRFIGTSDLIGPSLVSPPLTGIPSGYFIFRDYTIPYNTTFNGWYYIEDELTYTGPTINTLAIYNDIQNNPSSYGNHSCYILIDDISIKPTPAPVTFTPPAFCSSSSIVDLNAYVSATGGTFRWYSTPVTAGVPTIMTTSMFDPAGALSASLSTGGTNVVTVYYDYTDALGCVQTVSADVTINNPVPIIELIPTTYLCLGSTATLTIPGNTTAEYTWSPSVGCVAPSCVSVVVSPTTTTTYTISASGCPISTVTVLVVPVPTLTPTAVTVCPGTTTTLSVVSPTAAEMPYSWLPSVSCLTSSCNTVTVSPTITTTYTVSNVYGCRATSTVTVPVTLTGTTSTLCQYRTTTLTGSPSGGTWSVFPAGIVSLTSAGVVSGLGAAGTVTVSYTLGSCSATYIITNYLSPFSSVTPPTSNLCGAPVTLTANLSSGVGGIYSPVTYSWSPCSSSVSTCSGSLSSTTSSTVTSTVISSLPASTVYTFTATNAKGCVFSSTATVQVPCSELCAAGTVTTLGAGSVIPAGTYTGLVYIDNGTSSANISITGNVDFTNATVAIAPGKKINISAGRMLTATNSHFYCCSSTSTWEGFNVLTSGILTGQLFLQQGTLVEDAVKAVYVQDASPVFGASNPILRIKNVVFNRNSTAIEIYRYTGTDFTTPFDIGAVAITSRDMSGYYSAGLTYPFAWPSFTDLMTPYTPSSSVKVPYQYDMIGAKPLASGYGSYTRVTIKNATEAQKGVSLYKVGPVASSLYEGITFPLLCVDNMIYGIMSISANVYVNNSVFSYCHVPSAGLSSSDQGSGIRSIAVDGYKNRLALNTVEDADNANRFYDCYQAVSANSLESVQINKNQFYSTHIYTAYNPYVGKWGVYVGGNNFLQLEINNNYIANIENAIYANPTNDHTPSVNINVNDNRIYGRPTDWGLGYCQNGITVECATSTAGAATGLLNIMDNELVYVANGITVNNFRRKNPRQMRNHIWLINSALPAPPAVQWGIKNTNASENRMEENFVNGEHLQVTTDRYAYWNETDVNTYVFCNTEQNARYGFYFKGYTGAPNFARWKYNRMSANKYGLYLDCLGGIGTQGSPTEPSDNWWNDAGGGAWSASSGSWQTYNYAGSVSGTTYTVSQSLLYVRTGSAYNPVVNGSNVMNEFRIFGGLTGTALSTTYGKLLVSSPPAEASCAPVGVLIPPSSPLRLALLGDENNPIDSTAGGDTMANNGQRTTGMNIAQRMACRKWVEQYEIRQSLQLTPALLDSDIVLQSFYNSTQHSRYAWVDSIASLIAQHQYAAATALLDAGDAYYMNTTTDTAMGITIADGSMANGVVDNYKQFYRLHLQYLLGTQPLVTEDTVWLYNLAQSCPAYDGQVVYLAQALYNSISGDIAYFNTNCIDDASVLRKAKEVKSKQQVYTLYPNPSEAILQLRQAIATDEENEVVVWNAMGEVVYKRTLAFASGQAGIDVSNFTPGVYLLKIKDAQGSYASYTFVKQ